MSEDGPARLAAWLAAQHRAGARVIGINGSQGSGKSTLAEKLHGLLADRHGLKAVILSIDDLYLTRTQREQLAQQVHPLLRTRGVPGSHDVQLGMQILEQLKSLGATAYPSPPRAEEAIRIPKFIKALDDRAPEAEWPTVTAPADLVLFEGWCVGTPPQADAALATPVNKLERDEDADGVWRSYVNAQLGGAYAPLFALLDRLVFLRAPDFDSIFRWRLQQERKNIAALGATPPLGPLPSHGDSLRSHGEGKNNRAMDEAALHRFIQHYERLTRHALATLPGQADVVIELGPAHEWLDLRFR